MDTAFIATLTAAANDRRFRGNDPLGLLARYGSLRAEGKPVTVTALLDTARSSYEAGGELEELVEYGYLTIVGEDTREWRSDDDLRPVVLASDVKDANEQAEDERQAKVLNDMHVEVESARDALKARGTEEGRAFANLLASTFSQMRERIEADEPVGLLPHRIKRAVDAVLGTE